MNPCLNLDGQQLTASNQGFKKTEKRNLAQQERNPTFNTQQAFYRFGLFRSVDESLRVFSGATLYLFLLKNIHSKKKFTGHWISEAAAV